MAKIFKDASGTLLIAKEETYIVAHAFHDAKLTSYHVEAPQDAMAIRREILRLIKAGDSNLRTALDVFNAHGLKISDINAAWLACIACGKYDAKRLCYLDKAFHDSLR